MYWLPCCEAVCDVGIMAADGSAALSSTKAWVTWNDDALTTRKLQRCGEQHQQPLVEFVGEFLYG